jgi:oxaloacetate decarboxylase
MTPTERRVRFRQALEAAEVVYPAPVFDPVSARIAQMVGYEVGLMAGSVSMATEVCAPTGTGVLTSTELAQQVYRISRASDLSLVVVAEHGYGNALNVMRTVESLEDAGAAAIIIEDTAPLGFRRAREGHMISLDEALGKLRAAVAARRDPTFAIVGRTGRSLVDSIPETIERVKAFEGAGVDAIHLSGATTREAIAAVHAETPLPLFVSRLSRELEDRDFLAANGVRIASVGHLSLWASVQAVYDTLKALREGKTQSQLRPSVASPELMAEVTRQAQYAEWIEEFLN